MERPFPVIGFGPLARLLGQELVGDGAQDLWVVGYALTQHMQGSEELLQLPPLEGLADEPQDLLALGSR